VRALELMDTLRAARLEPKRIRTVCVRAEQPPYLLLVEAVKNAKPQLMWLPPLIVHDANGNWSPELQEIYQEE
jgi:tRNA1(Val) A37 N6-methylase TrmN6